VRILLTGKNGQRGGELQRTLTPLGEVIALCSAECNLAEPENIWPMLEFARPETSWYGFVRAILDRSAKKDG
jgi:dTDP-4-dehydrorhamnose reductase